MSHTRLWAAAIIIVVILLVGSVFSAPHTRDVAQTPSAPVATTTPSVTLHDAYRKGVHTITGSIEAPNACAVVSAQANPLGNASTTDGIQVAISLATDTNVCLQLPTKMDFSTTITAPANLPLSATVNGAPATTTAP
ncbi:MAG TPA: hypothetical protein PLW99_00270 [Candidatus Paceibacterota bacterium]|nr:MAG: hypothetical protein B7X03_02150 [Parcubacteria group bacterium 21-58-10]OYV83200.1 MAG: hypothetical protein B7W96_00365 [Parcubacteria group bacterium 37-58-5]HQT82580.1 hypothetical protein [Candidatus Paceibacterota bacterium]